MKNARHNYFKRVLKPKTAFKWSSLLLFLISFTFMGDIQAQDCCDQGDKVNGFTFTYTGGACPGNNSQGDKADCTGGTVNSSTVFIEATEKEDGGGDQYFSGNVDLGESFSFNSDGSEFPSKIFVRVGNQLNEIHASCSAPVVIGDQFGALLLEFATFKNGVQCGPPPPPECDNVTDGGSISGSESDCGPYNPGIISNVEEASGNSNAGGGGGNNGSDCCDQGDKPVELTFSYVGGSCPGNNSQDDKSDCFGGSENGSSVFIEATEKEDGGGDEYFSGTVSLGQSFTLTPDGDKFPSKIFVRVGNQVNEIHASCSAPLITGETYGAIRLDHIVFKDGFVCGPPPTPPTDYQWISSTNGCPNSISQAIPGATDLSYNPPTISQTTYYIRLARREFCEDDQVDATDGWIASNCVIKTVEDCNPCINQGGDTDGDGVCNDVDCQPFNPAFPANPGTSCDDGNPNTVNDIVQGDGCTCAGVFIDPCVNQGGDTDGDGVCNDVDCQPFNPAFPANPGTSCDDGNPNTFNDVVQGDGCTCAGTPIDPCVNQGGDTDGDGVCNNVDCQPFNPAFPTTPGTPCDDGNPGTINDVVQADGCTCAGTPTNACSVSVNTDGCVITINGLTDPVTNIKVFNSTFSQTLFACDPWGSNPCTPVETVSGLPNGTYFVSVNTSNASGPVCSFTQQVVISCAVDPCVNQGGDTDGDGVCNDVDCQPFNPAFPTNPGTSCDDGNPNTINDVVQADGCTCAGTPIGGGGAKVGDKVFSDNNGNGVQDGGEPGIGNVYIFLQNNVGANVRTFVTGNDGKYCFDDLDPGTYRVKFANPPGYDVSPKDQGGNDNNDSDIDFLGRTDFFSIAAGQIDLSRDGGFVPQDGPDCRIISTVTNIRCDDKGTLGNPNDDTFTFVLTATGGNPWGYMIGATLYNYDQATTFGPYHISGGPVSLALVDKDDPTCTDQVTVMPPSACSDGGGDGKATIGDFVFNDVNGNGIQDETEVGIKGVWIFLQDADENNVANTVSDAAGKYSFKDLNPGTYRIKFANPGGFSVSPSNQGANDLKDSDIDFLGYTHLITVAGGDVDNSIDAGFKPGSWDGTYEILDLNLSKQVQSVALNWVNNTGFKNAYFVIERSADGQHYEAIKEVDNANADRRIINYESIDHDPIDGTNFYRIKVIYMDETFTYTQARSVAFESTLNFSVFPNPSTDRVYLNIKPYIGKEVTITVYDLLSNTSIKSLHQVVGQPIIEMDMSDVYSGTYFIRISTKDGLSETQKLVIAKLD